MHKFIQTGKNVRVSLNSYYPKPHIIIIIRPSFSQRVILMASDKGHLLARKPKPNASLSNELRLFIKCFPNFRGRALITPTNRGLNMIHQYVTEYHNFFLFFFPKLLHVIDRFEKVTVKVKRNPKSFLSPGFMMMIPEVYHLL
ncbi:hypothetical protein CEXT_438791 [Caerostris extrusa]|uniref:Uncharacterized protein n=1 Tax=Caerostris extrusa TaxID=172846 RepID=A0AAV4MBE4_CAEEX|nr:hypothetical protein CEXT_438791 [Caerostris extrusa]